MRLDRNRTWKALIILACIAYQYLVHFSFSSALPRPIHLGLMWLPLAAVAWLVMARARNRLLWLAPLSIAGVVVYLMEHQEQLGLAAASGISHAAAYMCLLWYFGRTLADGKEPVVTRFARQVHGTLRPGMERFTRKLTIAWCVFFAGQLVASGLLFAFAPLGAWSMFINLLNLPLLALMFTGQWAYRKVRHPAYPEASIWQALEAFKKDASLSGSARVH